MTRYFSMPEEALRLPASEFKTYAVLRRMAECPAVDSLSREAEAVGLGRCRSRPRGKLSVSLCRCY